MFMGQYRHSLDEKNRLTVPAKFRDGLGLSSILTKGFDGALAIYTESEWANLLSQLATMDTNSADVRKHIRTITATAVPCEWDKQGRMVIPSHLVKLAGITKDCVLIGVQNHVEVWSLPAWERYYEEASRDFEAIAEGLAHHGI